MYLYVSIHRYATANNKSMKNHNKDKYLKYLSYLMYCNAKNLYGWRMSQRFPVN